MEAFHSRYSRASDHENQIVQGKSIRGASRVRGISQSGPAPTKGSAFPLLRLRLLSILAGERDHHAKPSVVLLVASVSARCRLRFCSFERAGARRETERSAESDP